MGIAVFRIIKQMERIDPKNWAKIVSLEKWLIMMHPQIL
jgi:hypothetical protein